MAKYRYPPFFIPLIAPKTNDPTLLARLGKNSIINLEIVIFFHGVFEQIKLAHFTDGQFAVNATGYRVTHKINWKEANTLGRLRVNR